MFYLLQPFGVVGLILMKPLKRPDGREIGEDFIFGGGEFRRLAEVIGIAGPTVRVKVWGTRGSTGSEGGIEVNVADEMDKEGIFGHRRRPERALHQRPDALVILIEI